MELTGAFVKTADGYVHDAELTFFQIYMAGPGADIYRRQWDSYETAQPFKYGLGLILSRAWPYFTGWRPGKGPMPSNPDITKNWEKLASWYLDQGLKWAQQIKATFPQLARPGGRPKIEGLYTDQGPGNYPTYPWNVYIKGVRPAPYTNGRVIYAGERGALFLRVPFPQEQYKQRVHIPALGPDTNPTASTMGQARTSGLFGLPPEGRWNTYTDAQRAAVAEWEKSHAKPDWISQPAAYNLWVASRDAYASQYAALNKPAWVAGDSRTIVVDGVTVRQIYDGSGWYPEGTNPHGSYAGAATLTRANIQSGAYQSGTSPVTVATPRLPVTVPSSPTPPIGPPAAAGPVMDIKTILLVAGGALLVWLMAK